MVRWRERLQSLPEDRLKVWGRRALILEQNMAGIAFHRDDVFFVGCGHLSIMTAHTSIKVVVADVVWM